MTKKKTKSIQYSISLKGLKTRKGQILFSTLKEIMGILSEGSERALRLSLEGVSVKRGTIPNWLQGSSDFVLTGLKKGSTVLVLEAPTLGSIAAEQIKQPDLWDRVPKPEETAISVLARSVRDAERGNEESDLYDRGVLETLLGFRKLLEVPDVRIEVTSEIRKTDRFGVDRSTYDQITALEKKIPDPQTVVLMGFLNMIQHNERRFGLTLEDGRTVKGRIQESTQNLELVRPLWGKQVTVKGVLHYGPSSKPRHLEAESITSRSSGDEVFTAMPAATEHVDLLVQAQKGSKPQKVVSEIWGKWPGSESIDELLAELKEEG